MDLRFCLILLTPLRNTNQTRSRIRTNLAWKPKPVRGDSVDPVNAFTAVHKLPSPESIKVLCEKSSGISCLIHSLTVP